MRKHDDIAEFRWRAPPPRRQRPFLRVGAACVVIAMFGAASRIWFEPPGPAASISIDPQTNRGTAMVELSPSQPLQPASRALPSAVSLSATAELQPEQAGSAITVEPPIVPATRKPLLGRHRQDVAKPSSSPRPARPESTSQDEDERVVKPPPRREPRTRKITRTPPSENWRYRDREVVWVRRHPWQIFGLGPY